MDLVEQGAGRPLASGAQPQVTRCPLAPVDVVVALPVFLNGSDGAVTKHAVRSLVLGVDVTVQKRQNPRFYTSNSAARGR